MDLSPCDIDLLLEDHAPNDPLVVEAMVHIFIARLNRLARAILNDPHEAEDAAQEALIIAASKLDQYQPWTNFNAWLMTIAVNVCRGMLRKRSRRRVLSQTLEETVRRRGNPASLDDAVQTREEIHSLREAVEALDEKHRLPVILRYGEQMTIAEIAQILEIRENTVHSRLHHARKKIHGYLVRKAALGNAKPDPKATASHQAEGETP